MTVRRRALPNAMCRIPLTALFLCGALAADARAQNPPPCPLVKANLANNQIDLAGNNNVHIALSRPDGAKWPNTPKIRFYSNELEFSTPVLDAPRGEGETTYTVRGTNPGLGRLLAKVDGWPSECVAIDQPLDLGFRDRVRLSLDLGEDLQAGQAPPLFSVRLTNADGRPTPAVSPLRVELQTSIGGLAFDRDAQDWQPRRQLTIDEGSSQSQPVYLRLLEADSGSGKMVVSLKMSSGSSTLHDTDFPLRVRLSNWNLFKWTAIGALVWWLASTILDLVKTKWKWRRFWTGLAASLAIAVVAFVVGPTRIGLTAIDQSNAMGTVAFGLLAAAFGLDGVLKKLMP